MSYSRIMVQVSPSEPARSRVRLAASLADRFGAELIGVGARPANLVSLAEYGSMEDRLIKQELQTAIGHVAEAERLFREACGSRNTDEWRSMVGWPTPFLIEQSRAADLIVIGRGDPDIREDGRFGVDQGEVLLRAGRPVLLTPPNLEVLSAKEAIVAWKDTREARRAVRDSLPLLRQAEEVTVTTIGPDQEEDTEIEDVCAYLWRHAVKAVPLRLVNDEVDASDQLLHLAKRRGADLIVAGGYGHGKLNEWIFGGMTRDLLTHTHVCCLLAH